MSNRTAECTLSNEQLVKQVEFWVSALCKSKGDAWTLRIPPDPNYDPDLVITELILRFKQTTSLREENERLQQWKESMLEIWGPVIDWGQSKEAGLRPGTDITKELVRRAKEYKQLQEEVERLRGRNRDLVDALSVMTHGATSAKIVCYCGSLRVAIDAFKKAEYEAVVKGEIALLPCCMFVDIQREYGAESDYKIKADEVHKRKIDICDEVFVLNIGGYIGDSTRSEIAYAESIGKPVKYLEALSSKESKPS